MFKTYYNSKVVIEVDGRVINTPVLCLWSQYTVSVIPQLAHP